SWSAIINSSETRAPYSTLIGVIMIGCKSIPPCDFLPDSATTSISFSIVKTNSFCPLNGIGCCCDKRARDDSPLTLLIKSVTRTGSNKVPLFNTIQNNSFIDFLIIFHKLFLLGRHFAVHSVLAVKSVSYSRNLPISQHPLLFLPQFLRLIDQLSLAVFLLG